MSMAGPARVTYPRHDDLVRALMSAARSDYPDAALRLMLTHGYRDARPDQIEVAMGEALARLEAFNDRQTSRTERSMS